MQVRDLLLTTTKAELLPSAMHDRLRITGGPNAPIYNSGYMDGFNVIRIDSENLYLLKLVK